MFYMDGIITFGATEQPDGSNQLVSIADGQPPGIKAEMLITFLLGCNEFEIECVESMAAKIYAITM